MSDTLLIYTQNHEASPLRLVCLLTRK